MTRRSGSISIGIPTLGIAVTVALAAVISIRPVVGIAVAVLLISAVWAAFKPGPAAVTLAFLTALFPKAGVKIGDFPFPVFLLGLVVAVLLAVRSGERRPHGPVVNVVLVLWLAFVLVRAAIIGQSSVSGAIAFIAWTAGPTVLLYVATQSAVGHPKFARAIEMGFLVSVVYGVVQLVGGVQATAVPGLTYAYGDDLTQKNNVIYSDTGTDYSKIPSTYQNGNIYGLVAAAFFGLVLSRVIKGRARPFDIVLLVGSCGAIALSGSRTAIVAAVFVGLLVYFSSGKVARKLGVLLLVVFAAVVVVALQPGLLSRYSIDDLLDSGGAGRSQMWRTALRDTPLHDYWIGAATDPNIEGWLGMLLRIGVVGVALLALVVFLLLRERRYMGLAIVVLGIGAVLDSSYLLFPTWFLFAALCVHKVGSDDRAVVEIDAAGRQRPRGLGAARSEPDRATLEFVA